jgi:glycosyltransferase involved in cell wall biosynthesis
VRVLLYSHFFAPSVGGVETVVRSLARGLAEFRTPDGGPEFEVTVVTQTPAGSFDDRTLPFAVVRRPGPAKLFRRIHAADVIHIAGPALAPLFLSWLMRKPFVIEHHGYQAICPNGILLLQPQLAVCPGHFQAGKYLRCLRCNAANQGGLSSLMALLRTFPRRWLARRASLNLTISSHVLRRHALPRSVNCYYGIEDPLAGGGAETSAAIPKENLCFAYVGRFVPEKGLSLLLEAAEQLQREGFRFDVRLVGDGPLRKALEDAVQRRGLTEAVQFTGFLGGQELAECLRAVHVVIMPSIWEETAGLAAIEQMMLGRLVIAAEIGGLGEVVGDAGLKFEPGSPKGLAVCMKQVLKNPAVISAIGSRARARALELYERRRMMEEHAKYYRQVFLARRMSQSS